MPEDPRIGGQAVIEGVMMRGPQVWAVAVRRSAGDIALRVDGVPRWSERWRRVPLARGVAALAESMSLGMRALSWSAAQHAGEAEGPPPTRGQLAVTMALGLAFFTAVFMVLPAAAAKAGASWSGWFDSALAFNALEGAVRLAMFLGYVAAIGLVPDIRRVFQYHGAEHKAITAWERGSAVTPEAAQRFSTLHVRCGTNFLLLVLALAIAVHSVFGRPGWAVLLASRVLTVPVVAALAYELLRLGARRLDTSRAVRALMSPGLALQRLTTRQPTIDQVEVAIASLRAAMTDEQRAELDARAAATGPAAPPAPAAG